MENQREFTHTTTKNEQIAAIACPSNTAEAGNAKACEGCPGQAFCKSGGQLDPDQEDIDIRMKAIRHKILVLSGKGGVGKSSVASQIAVNLAQRGTAVGMLDLDLCGPSIPTLMSVRSAEIVDSPYGWIPLESEEHSIKVMSVQYMLEAPDAPVVWRGPRKTALIKRFLKDTFWGKLDFLIVDTPPGTSDEHLTVIGALKNSRPDGAVVVTTPHSLSLATVRKEEITNVFAGGGGEALAREYSIPFLGKIPLDPRVGTCGDKGVSLYKRFPDSPCVGAMSLVLDKLLSALQ